MDYILGRRFLSIDKTKRKKNITIYKECKFVEQIIYNILRKIYFDLFKIKMKRILLIFFNYNLYFCN